MAEGMVSISHAWDIGVIWVKFIYLFLSHCSVIIALDCDGTTEYGAPPGPVTVRVIEAWVRKGYLVVLISDSGNCKPLINVIPWIPSPRGRRHESLNKIMQEHDGYVIYITDNEEDADVCSRTIDASRCRVIRPWNIEEWFNL